MRIGFYFENITVLHYGNTKNLYEKISNNRV